MILSPKINIAHDVLANPLQSAGRLFPEELWNVFSEK